MNSGQSRIAAGFILVSIIWGSTWLVIKVGIGSVPPFFAAAMRFALASLIIFVIMRLRGEQLPTDRVAVRLYLTLAVLSYSFPFALVYWGELYIPSGLASILFAVYPFVVAIGSHFVLAGERMNVPKMAGIVLGFAGVLTIFWGDMRPSEGSGLAMIGILASTVMQGSSLIIIKKQSRDISPASLSLGGMCIGVVILTVLAFIFEDVGDVHLDAIGIGSILYLATFGTVVTFLTYYWLLKRVQAVYLSFVTLVTPALAVFLGAVLLGEKLEPNVFTGATAICAGIVVANGRDIISAISQRKERVLPEQSI